MLIMLTELILTVCVIGMTVFLWLAVGLLPVVLPSHIEVALYRIVVSVSTLVASGGSIVGGAVPIALLPCGAAVVQGSGSKINQTKFEIHP